MRKSYLLLIIPVNILYSECKEQNRSYQNFTLKQKSAFLDTITKNAIVSIDDMTEIKKQPTAGLLIYTKYPLSEEKITEL